MSTRTMRNVVRIDETKCNGCGTCVTACIEGALRIINDKARLISESYCDGLGACLGDCPQGAISIETREADDYKLEIHGDCPLSGEIPAIGMAGCPSLDTSRFGLHTQPESNLRQGEDISKLSQWPIQLALISPSAPFLKDTALLMVADCVPLAYAGFHRDYLDKRAVAVACPKLDDFRAHQLKLNEIVKTTNIRSITVLRMEVPCCGGLLHMAKEAVKLSSRDIGLREIVIGIRGEVKSCRDL